VDSTTVTRCVQSVFNGMHVVFIPYSIMKIDPASWMKMVTRYRGKCIPGIPHIPHIPWVHLALSVCWQHKTV